MKKFFVFLMLMFCVVTSYAAKINRIVFFGDSLSDNGNLYSLLLHIIPKSPPYFEGRFSNGATWAEELGKHYYNKQYASYKIYALGGATAVFHMPSTKFISPTTLQLEVDKYLLDSLFTDRSETLFAIWIGGNDYLFDESGNADSLTSNVIDKISVAISVLKNYGAKNFLILNLPDLSRIPRAQGSSSQAMLHTLTVLHNQKLETAVQQAKEKYKDVNITTINLFDTFNDVMLNPDKYNKKYNVNITNTTDACWKGSSWLRATLADRGLENEIQQSLAVSRNTIAQGLDAKSMSDFIRYTPVLAEAYQLGKSYESGNLPCANPDEYLFWDSIHPSAVVHRILSQIIMEKLDTQFA
jgi:phospholipase/lecithinase/hemolysin